MHNLYNMYQVIIGIKCLVSILSNFSFLVAKGVRLHQPSLNVPHDIFITLLKTVLSLDTVSTESVRYAPLHI